MGDRIHYGSIEEQIAKRQKGESGTAVVPSSYGQGGPIAVSFCKRSQSTKRYSWCVCRALVQIPTQMAGISIMQQTRAPVVAENSIV